MTDKELETLVEEKLTAACKANEHPNKFFITQNGRGVPDGGDLYNALLQDVVHVVQQGVTEVLKEVLKK